MMTMGSYYYCYYCYYYYCWCIWIGFPLGSSYL